MSSSAHLRQLRTYFTKHESLPSVSALPLLFDMDEHAAGETLKEMIGAGQIVRARDGELRPGASFVEEGSPLAGHSITAGMPAALADDLHDRLNIHAYLVSAPNQTVIVPISGDSMLDAGIVDGDLGVIELRDTANVGDIVAAEIDGQFTLKRLVADADGIFVLKAENKNYPQLRAHDCLRIHGVLVGLARRY